MMPYELKPCPLCGRKVEIIEAIQSDFKTEVTIQCICGISFHHERREIAYEKKCDYSPKGYEMVGSGLYTSEDFVTVWNRRTKNE